ncbi:MAG: hypothetical protein ACM357_06895 [Gemmatimonadota bacterium]
MHSHRLFSFVAIVLTGTGTLSAQATADRARLVLSVNAGYIPGTSGWRVAGQPLYDDQRPEINIDTLSINRSIRPSLSFGAQAIYFAGDNLGFLGEAQLVGLGFRDTCTRTYATGSSRNTAVCANIDNAESSGSAVLVGAGAIYRLNSRSTVSPFARVGLGGVISTQSSIETIGRFPNPEGEPVEVELYPDESSTRLTAAATLALGFTAVIGRGYQVRWEVTDRIVGVRGVTGPTAQDGAPPPTSLRYRHLFGIQVGFDVVLERERGRRY